MPGSEDRTTEFLTLLTRHERGIYAYVLGLVGNFADADDVEQEVKLQLWREFDRFEPGSDFGAWARTLARYQAMAFISRRSRSRLTFAPDVMDLLDHDLPATTERIDERALALEECLSAMSPTNRELLQRVYTDGMPITRVAEECSRSVEALYKSLQRIRRALFECIQRKLGRGAPDA